MEFIAPPNLSSSDFSPLLTPTAGRILMVVRHGERADEADKMGWVQYCNENNHSRSDLYSVYNDPPLTSNGKRQAEETSQMVHSILRKEGISVSRIYASKLQRAYQTAYPIASLLQVPIYVSSTLALTAIAVVQSSSPFQYLEIEEIQNECPGVHVIDADTIDGFPKTTEWKDAVNYIANEDQYSIIVAHRETIRNIVGYRCETPYCCVAKFVSNEPGSYDLQEIFTTNSFKVET